MNRYFLNIGLWHAGTQDEMLVSHATAQIEAEGLRIKRLALVRKPDEEPSLVVEGSTHMSREELDAVVFDSARRLDQDCIARWWCPDECLVRYDLKGRLLPARPHPGRLVGPRAAEWGAFDADKFHFL